MNFLAHIYLSGPKDLIKIGNFTADGIRGKDYLIYPLEMQVGILLHRKIDSFTDNHTLFRQSSKRLYNKYSHYGRVIVDIYYDHFLARNWNNYSNENLNTFVQNFYKLITENTSILPPRFQQLAPHMITGNWLEGYADFDGITEVLSGMDRRTELKSGMSSATEDLKEHYNLFKREFEEFFNELISYSNTQRELLEEQLLK